VRPVLAGCLIIIPCRPLFVNTLFLFYAEFYAFLFSAFSHCAAPDVQNRPPCPARVSRRRKAPVFDL
jgi:hypothetical protein